MKDQEPIQLVPLKNIPTPPGVRFFFTTRHGGNSSGVYGSLNLGLHVDDDPLLVQQNRQTLLRSLSPGAKDLVFVNQVHGTTTRIAPLDSQKPADADALVTDRPHVAIGIMTADCVPVLLADAKQGVVGAAHAGWRGAAQGVLESCLDEMVKMGARPENIFAVIGPSIRPPNYAVGPTFPDLFLAQEKNKIAFGCQKFFSSASDGAIVQFDLPGYVRERLIWNRVSPETIFDVGLCTFRLDNLFFSHRRTTASGGVFCGRQMGGIYMC
jgi:polyphenol oxidase